MSRGPIVVIGDSLLDVDIEGEVERLCPDAPAPVVEVTAEHARPGGAGLAALLAARDGAEVVLVTAIGDDPAGRRLRGLLAGHVEVLPLPLRGATPCKTRVRGRGQTMVRLDTGDGRAPCRPAEAGAPDGRVAAVLRDPLGGRVAATPHDLPDDLLGDLPDDRVAAVLRGARAVLASDYGRGVTDLYRDVLSTLARPVVWDPHPRGGPPARGCALVTPSEAESRVLCERPYSSPGQAARDLAERFGAAAVAVTLSGRGAVLATRGGPAVQVPPPRTVTGQDSCGAGDRFAATAATAMADGATVREAVTAAVAAATAFVGQGGASAVRLPAPRVRMTVAAGEAGMEAEAVAARVRAAGGTVVATGGCFDLLHAGHVSLLRRARALGDALIVCLNSDESTRRVKGPDRPVVAEADRVEVLRALGCVDAVLVFDEETPVAAIERLRPAVWVKGGDYRGHDLPEAAAVHRAGGEIVILPLVPGRSTTGLIAAVRAAS
ncbi:D-glycero-beta-D-manno-heptose 1-phosphate adenylyltransferase [Sphaerisporangium sp. NPDC004334]